MIPRYDPEFHNHIQIDQSFLLVGDELGLFQKSSEVCFGCNVLVFDVITKLPLSFLW